MDQRKLLTLLLVVTFFKGIIWSALTPLWHTPDEQAHFAQVQNLVEVGGDPEGAGLSSEIALSEKLLGTYRDEQGKNRFTHHPEYKIPYTSTKTGYFEEEINKTSLSERRKFIKPEATNYPPLFYLLSSIPYRMFYQKGLVIRAFVVRLPSIIFCILTVYFTYLITKIIFPKNFLFQITSASLVSFHPMFTFVSSGTNSDNLFNALFTLFIYLFLVLARRFTLKNTVVLFLVFIAGIYTKQQMYVNLIPFSLLFLFLFLKNILKKKTRKNKKALFLQTTPLLALFLVFLRYLIEKKTKGMNLIPEISLFPKEKAIEISFPSHIIWTVRHTIAEVVPWYWGVFKWLGVTLPRAVNRIINLFTLMATIGLLIKFINIIRKKDFRFSNVVILLLFLFSVYYFLILLIWDYFFRIGHGFSLGFQGRYYFSTISAHMILLLIGLLSFIPQGFKKGKTYLAKILISLMVLLNFIGLYTLTNSYYDLSNLNLFLLQSSQYKPYFYKSPFLVILGIIYLSLLGCFLLNLIKFKPSKNKK